MERKENISIIPQVVRFVKLIEFVEEDEKCYVYVFLSSNDAWQKIGYRSFWMEEKIDCPSEIQLYFRNFNKSDIDQCIKSWNEEHNPSILSFIKSPFKRYKIQENTLLLEDRGSGALERIQELAKYVDPKKIFFHSVISKLVEDPLLSILF